MRTLTKEWLQLRIAELEEERDATPGAVNEDATNALAAMKLALAPLEAEPVAWIVHARTGDQLTNDGGYVANAEGILGLHSTPLYTAPVVQCPFPCGWGNLNKHAIQDAAFISRGLVEGEIVTEALRKAAIANNELLLKVIATFRSAPAQGDKE